MAGMGYAMMGTATGRGENAAVEAARAAISCPLLEGVQIAGSRGILINITGSRRASDLELKLNVAVAKVATRS